MEKLNNHFAKERTVLANERTYLAYCRTALTLLVAGATFERFFISPAYVILGYIFIIIGVVSFAIGTFRFARFSSHINKYD